MRAGIVTLNGKHNYGNRLQNYALQAVLKEMSVDPINVNKSDRISSIQAIKNVLKPILAHTLLYPNRSLYFAKIEKATGFHAFDDRYIAERSINQLNIGDIDVFIAGSDQVWNPSFAGTDYHFLSFAPKEKRVSYAASFGVSEIPSEKHSFYKKHLEGMASISVREEAGVRIVKELTGREATLVPDPTILLSREEWDELLTEHKHLEKERYLVIYTLYDLDDSAKSQIESYANERGLEIYRIMGDLYHPDYRTPDPAEFVARIKYAEAVFTDSFHACVFSIIMHTPFKVFERKDMKMSSRLDTLLNTYGMQVAMSDKPMNSKDYNFQLSDKIAREERNRGMRYLSQLILQEKVE